VKYKLNSAAETLYWWMGNWIFEKWSNHVRRKFVFNLPMLSI